MDLKAMHMPTNPPENTCEYECCERDCAGLCLCCHSGTLVNVVLGGLQKLLRLQYSFIQRPFSCPQMQEAGCCMDLSQSFCQLGLQCPEHNDLHFSKMPHANPWSAVGNTSHDNVKLANAVFSMWQIDCGFGKLWSSGIIYCILYILYDSFASNASVLNQSRCKKGWLHVNAAFLVKTRCAIFGIYTW